MKLKEGDITNRVCLLEIKNLEYFRYILSPEVSSSQFKQGLLKASQQMFIQASSWGRFLDSLSDIAHDETRPYLWCPLWLVLSGSEGEMGAMWDRKEAFAHPDISTSGLRDFDNFVRKMPADKQEAFFSTFKVYRESLKILSGRKTWNKRLRLEGLQESMMMKMLTLTEMILSQLHDNPEDLMK